MARPALPLLRPDAPLPLLRPLPPVAPLRPAPPWTTHGTYRGIYGPPNTEKAPWMAFEALGESLRRIITPAEGKSVYTLRDVYIPKVSFPARLHQSALSLIHI